MVQVYKNKAGQKLYPVCSWQNNQHKLYNASDRARIWEVESGYSEKASAEVEEIDRLIDIFNNSIIGGLVYATYADYVKIKEIIAAYDARH